MAVTDARLAANSYYTATAPLPPAQPALDADAACDVAVVGGGIAGLSAALELAQRGFDVRLLEAGRVGGGASGRNGGQAIHGLACDQQVIEAQLGVDDARRVWAMSIEALELLRRRIAEHAIDCEWQDGFLGLATSARKARALAAWADRIESVYGYALTRIDAAEVGRWIASPRFHGGIHDARSGHLHPLKYTLGLARAAAAAGVQIHENARVERLDPGQPALLHGGGATLRARQVVLAGNVYLGDLVPAIAGRIMPVGTYIGCTEPLGAARAAALVPSRAAVCDTNFVLDYFRPTADHRLLYGGRVSYSGRAPVDVARSMRQRLRLSFPQLAEARIEYAWGGHVDISMNRAPDFGRLGAARNVYYLQGFSGHGLALAGLAGRIVAEAIAGDASRFDVFARLRHRDFPGGAALRMPALVLGMAWYRLRDMLG
ncbi:MAG: FAD-binding oxidoreductase [Burkholderiales bacterium]|nr:FAD-binding oxidoreductase [Burkholderiales bacterium]MDE2502201.1 FAD-binding oxidoreductase [Burkholderiales bacterium]